MFILTLTKNKDGPQGIGQRESKKSEMSLSATILRDLYRRYLPGDTLNLLQHGPHDDVISVGNTFKNYSL